MKNKHYTFILRMLVVCWVAHLSYQIRENKRENDIYIKSIEKQLKTVQEHAQYMDSIHYSKCGWVLREDLKAVTE